MYYFLHKTVFGNITICAQKDAVTGLYFDHRHFPGAENVESAIIHKAFVQLVEYSKRLRKVFDLKFVYNGSNFQISVWNQLKKIPHGETRTYKEIARAINNPASAVAVGRACAQNPISIFIPCHRVIGSDGSLTGYGGGINLKKKLLEIEKTAQNAF
ncbi:MAG: methylated-DNA--[protein]-cysteine S-methyltransferase [Holosporaceae bacterium]|jgi:methylated-DNA-[protein]-cysteine S-methyltransferase|nr:methylated-DNA--[protein]-cysteine S-methyltransferase [Holosporaceae bacterium]